jgi:hydrogenase expression/formation protein HypE
MERRYPLKAIDLSVGSGGKSMREFIERVVMKYINTDELRVLGDSAILNIDGQIAFTTDSFVINPIFFPGGDIGKLCVAGTVNDLVVSGARPWFLSLSFIIEEGFPVEAIERILKSIRDTAIMAGVKIVTGDTKVVKKGEADGIYINTAGIGKVIKNINEIKEGDLVVITGSPGDHGVAIMVARGEFEFEGEVLSDCAPLTNLLPLWEMNGVKWMRDITRGGLASVLCEFGMENNFTVFINEEKIPFSPPVRGVSEILGIDPLYLPSEGKAVIVVSPDVKEEVIGYLKKNVDASADVIGEVRKKEKNFHAVLKTISGGYRILELLTGELLPRIC